VEGWKQKTKLSHENVIFKKFEKLCFYLPPIHLPSTLKNLV
jgi:hypothetical protein